MGCAKTKHPLDGSLVGKGFLIGHMHKSLALANRADRQNMKEGGILNPGTRPQVRLFDMRPHVDFVRNNMTGLAVDRCLFCPSSVELAATKEAKIKHIPR